MLYIDFAYPETEHEVLSYLAERVSYNKETGRFTWKARDEKNRWGSAFNKKYAGKVCGLSKKDDYTRIQFNVNDKPYSVAAHRLAWFVNTGEVPSRVVDHINGDKSDNRIQNLRCVTFSLNSRNSFKSKANKSGVTGVHWLEAKGYWRAVARIEGVSHEVGYFREFDAAKEAVEKFRSLNGFTDRHGSDRPVKSLEAA